VTNGEILFHATFNCRASGSNSQSDWEEAAARYEAVKAERDARLTAEVAAKLNGEAK
jgi:hypothetical protein